MNLTPQQEKVLDFVKHWHGNQKRKYTGEPYWHHLVSVAEILVEHGHDDLIEVALLHDVLEDTKVEIGEIVLKLQRFNYVPIEETIIMLGVMQLTDFYTSKDFPFLNREARKAKEAVRLSQIEPAYQTVKYADLVDNTKSILEHDPSFAKVYLQEKQDLLKVMNKGDQTLYKKACTSTENI